MPSARLKNIRRRNE